MEIKSGFIFEVTRPKLSFIVNEIMKLPTWLNNWYDVFWEKGNCFGRGVALSVIYKI